MLVDPLPTFCVSSTRLQWLWPKYTSCLILICTFSHVVVILFKEVLLWKTMHWDKLLIVSTQFQVLCLSITFNLLPVMVCWYCFWFLCGSWLVPYMCCLCYMCVILNLITRLLHYLLPSCCEHLVWSLGQLVILRDVRSCTAVLLRSQLLLALFDPVNAHHDFWGKIIEKYSNSLEFTVAFIIDVNKFIRVEFSFSLHIHQLALKFSKDG